MAVKQLPKLSELPEPPDRLVGDQERFDTMTFDSLKAQKKMVNEDLNKTFIPKLNEFAVDVNASVTAAAQSERNAAASATTAGNKATQAASSAATTGTKAGEAAQSAAAAKTSETNAAASKSAAAKSATDAATAQRGAEAARDEAQNLANVGYASKAKAGLAKVDGKTTQADAGGMITVEDVLLDPDGTTARGVGQLGRAKSLTGVDLNTLLVQGRYNVYKATTALNSPFNTDILLDVIYWGDNNVTQIVSTGSTAYQWEMARSSYDNGATWGTWLPRSGFLNTDLHIYVAKNGSDTNSGYSSDQPVLSINMVIYKMLMMKPGMGRSVFLHFGPGEWADVTLYNYYSSGTAIVVTSLAGGNSPIEPADMPKFGTLTAANGAMVLVRNIEADRVACSYQSRIHAQYYNKIGAVVARYSGRFFFDSTSVTGIKAQTVQPTAFANLYRHGSLDIINGATFDILENVTYSASFLYAADYSVINIGSSITAASFKNAARVTGKKFHFVSAEIVDTNTRRTLFPGTSAGTYGNGNLINGMAMDVTVDGTPSDTAVKRGQIGDAVIVSAPNFNTLIESGFYHCYQTDAQNGPGNYAAKLHVLANGSYICQIAYRMNVVTASVRVSQDKGATWTAWAELATKGDVAASLRSYLPLSGGTLTGNVAFPVNETETDVKTLRLGVRVTDTDGTPRNFYPIRVIPGSTLGRGLILCPTGPLILGGGESAQTFAKGHIGAGKLNGETEYTYITSDNGIEFCYGQNAGYDAAKKITISAAGDMAMPGKITASGGFKGNATGLGTKEFVDARVSGTPLWLLGLHSDGKLRPFNKSDIQAGYADSAGSANARFLNIFSFATANAGVNLPAGGTWLVFAQWYSYGGDFWEVSGKQAPWIGYRAGGSRIEEKRLGFALRIS